MKQPRALIELLLSPDAEYGDRLDAAMDLGAFDEVEAERALASVGSDASAEEGLVDAVGESLAEIWSRRKRVPQEILVRLREPALRTALAGLSASSPALAVDAERLLSSNR